jgi:hypothetical protein
MFVRSWPLAGFRLSHRRVQAALSVYWPWPPSLVDRCRLGTPFGALAVLRGHPTPAVPSPPRPFVLGDYQRSPPGGRQVSPGKGQRASHEPVTNTCGRPTDFGLCDWRLAYPRLACLTVLRLRSVPCCTYDFHQTVPRGSALVFCVGFPLPRFQKDFHLLLSARAGRNSNAMLGRAAPCAWREGGSWWSMGDLSAPWHGWVALLALPPAPSSPAPSLIAVQCFQWVSRETKHAN